MILNALRSPHPLFDPAPTIEVAGIVGAGQELIVYPPWVKRNLAWLNSADTLSDRVDVIEAASTRDHVKAAALAKRSAIAGPAIIGAEVESLLEYNRPAMIWDKEYLTVRSAKMEAVVEGMRLASQPGDKICLYKTLLFPWIPKPWLSEAQHRRRRMLFAQYNRTMAQRFVEATDIVILEFYADSRRSDADTEAWIGDAVNECREELTGDRPLLAAFWGQYSFDDPLRGQSVAPSAHRAHRAAAIASGCEYVSLMGGIAPWGPTVQGWNQAIGDIYSAAVAVA